MKIQDLILGLIMLFGLFSNCKKKNDGSSLDPNIAPTFTLTSLDGKSIKTDSIKIGLKSPRKLTTYYLTIGGNDKSKEITAKTINGIGSLSINSRPEGSINLSNGTYMVEWKPSALGITLIKLELRDSNKNIREISVEVTAFDNIPPVAALKAEKLSSLTPMEYLIDASGSYDRDLAYGGGIVSYEYNIAGKKFKTDRPSIKWIFEVKGNYKVSVKVIDLDGSSSEVSTLLAVI